MSDNQQGMPPPPQSPIEPEREAAAEERWHDCPLRDCKQNSNLLYSDFYLRDMRTNRLMCNACTVRTSAGYIAREVVRSHDNRFYTGDILSDSILFGVMLVGSLGANIFSMFIGFYYGFMVGGAVGVSLALLARKLAHKKVTRQSHIIGTAGIIAGAVIAPTALSILSGYFEINIVGIFNGGLMACTAGMVIAAWSVFLRKITFRF